MYGHSQSDWRIVLYSTVTCCRFRPRFTHSCWCFDWYVYVGCDSAKNLAETSVATTQSNKIRGGAYDASVLHGRRQTFSPGAKGGGTWQGMWGQISAMEGLLVNAWMITGGGGGSWGGGQGQGTGEAAGSLPPPPLTPPMQCSTQCCQCVNTGG